MSIIKVKISPLDNPRPSISPKDKDNNYSINLVDAVIKMRDKKEYKKKLLIPIYGVNEAICKLLMCIYIDI